MVSIFGSGKDLNLENESGTTGERSTKHTSTSMEGFTSLADSPSDTSSIYAKSSLYHVNDTEGMQIGNYTGSFTIPLWSVGAFILTGIGTVGNSLVILVILLSSLRKSVFMTLLMFLAVTDNSFLWNVTAGHIAAVGYLFPSTLLKCRLMSFIYYTTGITSSWLLVLISLERFIAVAYPLKVHIYCTMKRTYILISIIGVVASLSSLSQFFTCSVSNKQGKTLCKLTGSNPLHDLIFTLTVGIMYTTIPFCIITTFNVLTIKKIKLRKSLQSDLHFNSKQNIPLVAMMLAVSGTFAVALFPSMTYLLFQVIYQYSSEQRLTIHAQDYGIVFLLDYFNHSVNFILYCLTGSAFRKAAFNIFRCRFRAP